MRVIDCSGDPQQIGECTGEALRLEIAEHIELFPMQRWQEFDARLPDFLEALQRHLPQVLEEIRATARGAGVEEREILRLNLPLFAAGLDPDTSGCTNFVFSGGRDGPLWGKNNDGCEPHRPVVARYVRSTEGIPQVTFTFAGLLAITDGMNAEGVAVGHSSVGSQFQQSDRYVPIRLWAYELLSRARTTSEFVRGMTEIPLRGKGYAATCVDAEGTAVGIDAACPLLQIREPADGASGLHAVNCYQHPALLHADRSVPVMVRPRMWMSRLAVVAPTRFLNQGQPAPISNSPARCSTIMATSSVCAAMANHWVITASTP